MKRILQVCYGSMGIGGVEQLLMNVYNEIDRDEIQFDFLVDGEPDSFHYDEVIRLGGRFFSTAPRKKALFKHFKDTYRILKENEFYAVHIHNDCFIASTIFLAKMAGVKNIIAHAHCTLSHGLRNILIKVFKRYISKNAKVLCTCSKKSAECLFGADETSSKYNFLPNAIDVENFRFNPTARDEIRRELGIENNLVITTVGRLSHEKNQTFLIDVLNEAVKIDNTVKLLIVGEGSERVNIEQKIKKYDLESYVIFTGARDDVNRILQASDVFVLTSFTEGFPVVLTEAQASGLPFVVSTGVTTETNIINKAKYLSLEQSCDVWAKALIDCAEYTREDSYELVKQAGFDIVDVTKNWTEMYLSL